MFAILRRELYSYFTSPIGYIYLAVIYFFSGYYFSMYSLSSYRLADLTYVFDGLFSIVLFLVPILTMRLLSEDNKNRTDQALLTAPVSLVGLVLGKFLAAATVYLLGISLTGVFTIIIGVHVRPNYAIIFGNFIAILLLGCALIAICMLISAMTENQVIAAVGGFAASLFLFLINALASTFSNPIAIYIINGLSFGKRYSQFTSGIFDISAVVFFLSVIITFVFLTVRVLEKRRWS